MLSPARLSFLTIYLALCTSASFAHPLDLSSEYSANLISRATANISSSLETCLSKTGATLTYSGTNAYSTLAKAENTNYHYNPDVIARPNNVQQVSSIVKCVAANNGKTKITTRSGGHGYAASSLTGNVVIDLGKMTDLTLSDSTKTVSVGAGMTLGPLAKAIGDKGYALPHGTCPTVGVGGHGLGGGYGFTSRAWGWLMDHIIEIQLVDPRGNIKTLSQKSTGEDADLWWSLRGAGSNNYGVVTNFVYSMVTAPTLITNYNSVYKSNSDCVQLMLALQDLGTKSVQDGGLPIELGGEALLYGENSGNDGACSFSGQYLGSKDNFKKVKKLLNDQLASHGVTALSTKATEFNSWVAALTDIMGDLTGPKIYEQYYAQSIIDDGSPNYTQQSVQAIVNAVQAAVGVSGSGNSISFDLNGFAAVTNAASPTGDMSFVHRNSLFLSQIYSYDFPGFDKPQQQQAALKKLNAITQSVRNAKPSATFLSYQNYLDPNLVNFGSQYYGSALNRLKSIKTSVDPNTVFDFAQGLAHA